jgi:tRNA U34 5-methylaminomethyl-2-thiouridine-forming methyltransferase MnmC
MKRQIIITDDGSTTIQLSDWNEQYHSKHGAIQEAQHVFLNAGLHQFTGRQINILEMGFGTGLNCLLTAMALENLDLNVYYVGVEGYPVNADELGKMNYLQVLSKPNWEPLFKKMHKANWESPVELTERMVITKRQQLFSAIDDVNRFDLVYFDAFGARVQPDLWTVPIFSSMYTAMKTNGILVTYSAKGSVRRAMQEVGFVVERLPGPPGKREMLRAKKI